MPAPPATDREQFLKASPPIRLDAFENYIRGTMATDRQQKVRYFRNAVKLNPRKASAYRPLGMTQVHLGSCGLAESYYRKAVVAINPLTLSPGGRRWSAASAFTRRGRPRRRS